MKPAPVILINHLLEPPNKISGISNYLFYLLNRLLDNPNFSYVLVTCWDENRLPAMLQNRGLIVETLPYIESTPKNILSQYFRIHKLIKQYNPALEFNPEPIAGVNLLRALPLVHVVHDLYFDVSPASYKFHHRLWWKLFFPMTLRRAKKTICVSENTKNDLVKYHASFRQQITVIKEAACLNGEYREVVREPFGVFVANVSPNKGAENLIKAMKCLEEAGKPVTIYHVGRDSVGYLDQYATQYNLKEKPVPLGYLDDAHLADMYSKARFLAFPSLYEGFGLPVLEAQKFGLPVIASDIAVLREVAGKGAAFTSLGDATALAAQMDKLIKDDEYFNALSDHAIDNAAKFSWAKAATETESVFNTILETERK
jgi:glycosyltransferase involved in cell wall biosynthesis